MASRSENRLVAVQFLYAWADTPCEDWEAAWAFFLRATYNTTKVRKFGFGYNLVEGTLQKVKEIDVVIAGYLKNWELKRIAKTDLAILRLAIYELLYRNDIPPVVSINEAVELTKSLSSEESKAFVNGVLDKVKEQVNRPLRSGQE